MLLNICPDLFVRHIFNVFCHDLTQKSKKMTHYTRPTLNVYMKKFLKGNNLTQHSEIKPVNVR